MIDLRHINNKHKEYVPIHEYEEELIIYKCEYLKKYKLVDFKNGKEHIFTVADYKVVKFKEWKRL